MASLKLHCLPAGWGHILNLTKRIDDLVSALGSRHKKQTVSACWSCLSTRWPILPFHARKRRFSSTRPLAHIFSDSALRPGPPKDHPRIVSTTQIKNRNHIKCANQGQTYFRNSQEQTSTSEEPMLIRDPYSRRQRRSSLGNCWYYTVITKIRLTYTH